MTPEAGGGFRLNVLNPGGRDPEQDFQITAAADACAHAPVNFHAYAACTGGSFLREVKRAVELRRPVLLLMRGDFRDSERALNFLKKAGVPVVVSLKETGLHQIANQMADASKLSRFCRMLGHADGCIAATPEAADFFRTFRTVESVAFIPTPYPLHDANWNFSRPCEERRGIFVGTREFDVPSRNHLFALRAAKKISDETGAPVTVYNCDGRKGAGLLADLGFAAGQLTVLKRSSNYVEYLRVVAEHRIVFQLDTSFVPGQVAGDALLCRLPCVGGNGAIDRIAFSEICGANRSIDALIEIAVQLLRDDSFSAETIADSQRRAEQSLSFNYARAQLERGDLFCSGGL